MNPFKRLFWLIYCFFKGHPPRNSLYSALSLSWGDIDNSVSVEWCPRCRTLYAIPESERTVNKLEEINSKEIKDRTPLVFKMIFEVGGVETEFQVTEDEEMEYNEVVIVGEKGTSLWTIDIEDVSPLDTDQIDVAKATIGNCLGKTENPISVTVGTAVAQGLNWSYGPSEIFLKTPRISPVFSPLTPKKF